MKFKISLPLNYILFDLILKGKTCKNFSFLQITYFPFIIIEVKLEFKLLFDYF